MLLPPKELSNPQVATIYIPKAQTLKPAIPISKLSTPRANLNILERQKESTLIKFNLFSKDCDNPTVLQFCDKMFDKSNIIFLNICHNSNGVESITR